MIPIKYKLFEGRSPDYKCIESMTGYGDPSGWLYGAVTVNSIDDLADWQAEEITIDQLRDLAPELAFALWPLPWQLRADAYKTRCDPILVIAEAYQTEYDITGGEDLPAKIAAKKVEWWAERQAIRDEYPD
jgi:hypothetical protein